MMDIKSTAQTDHHFTLDELNFICEALQIYARVGRRMAVEMRYTDTNEHVNTSEEDGSDVLAKLMAGEVYINPVVGNEEIDDDGIETIDNLIKIFVSGMASVEEKNEEKAKNLAMEELPGVMDEIYKMLGSDSE